MKYEDGTASEVPKSQAKRRRKMKVNTGSEKMQNADRDEAPGDVRYMDDEDDVFDLNEEELYNENMQELKWRSAYNMEEKEDDHIPIKQPCILVFDSLGGTKARKSKVCETLREYLWCEYMAKIGKDSGKFSRDWAKEFMPFSSPKVQQQPNFSDCGVYLLQYVESFFEDPISDYTLPITTLKSWFSEDGVKKKRAKIAELIRNLTAEQNPDKNITFPNLVFTAAEPDPQPDVILIEEEELVPLLVTLLLGLRQGRPRHRRKTWT